LGLPRVLAGLFIGSVGDALVGWRDSSSSSSSSARVFLFIEEAVRVVVGLAGAVATLAVLVVAGAVEALSAFAAALARVTRLGGLATSILWLLLSATGGDDWRQ
jgi:hypothetical protein